MRLVILESPFAGDVEANTDYARACLSDSLKRGEAPIASHLLYTQPGVLDDDIPQERKLGIDAGLAWRRVAEGSVVYIDRGVSTGMKYGITAARDAGLPVMFRSLEGRQIPRELQELVAPKQKPTVHICFEDVDDQGIRAIIIFENEDGEKEVFNIIQFGHDAQLAPHVRLITRFMHSAAYSDAEVRYTSQWDVSIKRLRSVDSCLRKIIRAHPGKSGDFSKTHKLN